MKRHASQSRWFGPIANGKLMLVAGVLVAGASVSQAAVQDLPPAERILDKHVEATGGKDAYLRLKSRKMTGKLAVDIAGHKFDAKVEKLSQAPNKTHLIVDSPFIFKVRVSNGEDVWEWRPSHDHGSENEGNGDGKTVLLTGEERTRALDDTVFNIAVDWRKKFKKVETLGVADVEEKPAYEIRVTTHSGYQYSQFYDQESGRLVKFVRDSEVPNQGKLHMQGFIGDYREFDGVWLPTRIHEFLDYEGMGKGTQTWTYSDIQHNVKIAKSLFEMPAEVKEQKLEAERKELQEEKHHGK